MTKRTAHRMFMPMCLRRYRPTVVVLALMAILTLLANVSCAPKTASPLPDAASIEYGDGLWGMRQAGVIERFHLSEDDALLKAQDAMRFNAPNSPNDMSVLMHFIFDDSGLAYFDYVHRKLNEEQSIELYAQVLNRLRASKNLKEIGPNHRLSLFSDYFSWVGPITSAVIRESVDPDRYHEFTGGNTVVTLARKKSALLMEDNIYISLSYTEIKMREEQIHVKDDRDRQGS